MKIGYSPKEPRRFGVGYLNFFSDVRYPSSDAESSFQFVQLADKPNNIIINLQSQVHAINSIVYYVRRSVRQSASMNLRSRFWAILNTKGGQRPYGELPESCIRPCSTCLACFLQATLLSDHTASYQSRLYNHILLCPFPSSISPFNAGRIRFSYKL